MKNKIILKNRKFRFVFRNVDSAQFKKVYKYLLGLKKEEKKVKEVPKQLPKPKEAEAKQAPEPE